MNVVTKSGSNQFDGSVFAYSQPTALQGTYRQFQATNGSVSTIHTDASDGGAEGGGPIVKNKVFFFGAILYLAVRIPLAVLRFEMAESPDARVIKALAMAILATSAGAMVGIFFLSWTYHYVLWIHLGLVSSLHAVVERTYPTFEVKLTWREARNVCLGYVGLLVVWSGYIKHKGAWD